MDKLLHLTVSCIIFIIVFKLVPWITFNWIIATVVTLGIGILKEFIDKKRGGLFDQKDILADIGGLILGGLICLI